MTPFGLMFHHFHDGKVHLKGQGSLTAEDFRNMLLHVGVKNILSPTEWINRVLTQSLEPHQRCLTFDDALKCQYDIAKPVMDELGVQAFWFIYTSIYEGQLERLEIFRHFMNKTFPNINDFHEAFFKAVEQSPYVPSLSEALKSVDITNYLSAHPFYSYNDRKYRYIRNNLLTLDQFNSIMDKFIQDHHYRIEENVPSLWMAKEELRTLAQEGHLIGVHSHTHPYTLGMMSRSEQESEYVQNFNLLEKITGKKPICGAHPCDSFNQDTLDILQKLGIKIMFRSNMRNPVNAYELPREDHANIMREMRA